MAQFTSGRRGPNDQARAMAKNEFTRPGWISQVYKDGPAKFRLLQWLMQNPNKAQVELEAGFLQLMLDMPTDVLASLSRHFTGDAWDAAWPKQQVDGRWVDDDVTGNEMYLFLLAMPLSERPEKVLTNEAGLKVLHAQWKPEPATA